MKIIYTALACLLFQACTSGYEEMNTNPNKQSSLSNDQAVLQAEITLSTEILESRETGIGKWVQYYTGDINSTKSIFSSDFDIFWNYQSIQVSALRSIDEVFRNTAKVDHPNYKAIAMVLKSWANLYMTDLLGSVPYFDATQGDVPGAGESAFRPKFDSQEEIYKDINEKLKEANGMFIIDSKSEYAINPGCDIFAAGDMSKWKIFANSLRARMLLRMSDVAPEFAKSELTEMLSNPDKYPLMKSNDDDFYMIWTGAAGASYANTLAEQYRKNKYTWGASSGLVNMLGRNNDPRMSVYFEPAKDCEKAGDILYIGAPMAINKEKYKTFKKDSISEVNSSFATYDQKKYVITYSELMFIMAEASAKGLVDGDAKNFYEEGVKSNMQKYGIESDKIESYLAQDGVKYDSNNYLELIMNQRYIAMFFQSREIFAEIRRTGYPLLDYFSEGTNADDIKKGYPEKHFYPGSSDIRRQEYLDAMNISENSLWGCKLWFASKRTRPISSYVTTAPTSLSAWRKVGDKYEHVLIPYFVK